MLMPVRKNQKNAIKPVCGSAQQPNNNNKRTTNKHTINNCSISPKNTTDSNMSPNANAETSANYSCAICQSPTTPPRTNTLHTGKKARQLPHAHKSPSARHPPSRLSKRGNHSGTHTTYTPIKLTTKPISQVSSSPQHMKTRGTATKTH